MRRFAILLMLAVLVFCGLYGSPLAESADLNSDASVFDDLRLIPQTFDSVPVAPSGVVWTESTYSGTFGTTTIGGTSYPPSQMVGGTVRFLPQERVETGVFSKDLNYAFLVTSHLTNPLAPSTITKTGLSFEYADGSTLPTSTGAQYKTIVADAEREFAYLGYKTAFKVDEVSLAEPTTDYNVIATHDFSDVAAGSTSFVSSALDSKVGFVYFGGANMGRVAMLELRDGTSTAAGAFSLPIGSDAVAAIEVDEDAGFVFFAATGSSAIHTYSAATGEALPLLLSSRTLAPEMPGTPLAMTIDSERRHLFVTTDRPGTVGFSVGRYRIAIDGSLIFEGKEEVDTQGGHNLLYDNKHHLLYTVGGKYLYRFISLPDAATPFIKANDNEPKRLITSEGPDMEVAFSALSPDTESVYLTSRGGNKQPETFRIYTGSTFDIRGKLIQQDLQYTGAKNVAELTSFRVYTHSGGGVIRMGLIDLIREDFVWVSPPVQSVEEGWTTVNIADGIPSGPISLPRYDYFRFVMVIDPESPHPYPGFVNEEGSSRISGEETEFLPPFWDNSEIVLGTFSLNVTYLDKVEFDKVRLVAKSGPYPESWTNSPDVTVYLDGVLGAPNTLTLSETGDFNDATVIPGSPIFEHTFAGLSSDLQLYVKGQNRLGESPVRVGSIAYDPVPPPQAVAPIPVQAVSFDSSLEFTFDGPFDDADGSGFYQREIEIGTAPGLADIFSGISTNPDSIAIEATPGATVYCRTRVMDKAGNLGEWSESSVGARVNRAPVITGLSVLPVSPRTIDEVTPVFDVSDPDGELIASTEFEWHLNGSIQTTTHTLSQELTTKLENWTVRVRAADINGQFGDWVQFPFTIINSLPTQPVVKLVPETPSPDDDLIVDVQVYSTDLDGDEVGVDFFWYKSIDGGETLIEKTELRGLPQVSKNFINEGEVWEVRYVPFERIARTRGADPERVEGKAAIDRVFIGENGLPEIRPGNPIARTIATKELSRSAVVSLFWEYSEPDGEACTVDLYWTDTLESGLVEIGLNVPAEKRYFSGTADLPTDRPSYVHVIIRDAKGAISQVTTAAIVDGQIGDALLSY